MRTASPSVDSRLDGVFFLDAQYDLVGDLSELQFAIFTTMSRVLLPLGGAVVDVKLSKATANEYMRDGGVKAIVIFDSVEARRYIERAVASGELVIEVGGQGKPVNLATTLAPAAKNTDSGVPSTTIAVIAGICAALGVILVVASVALVVRRRRANSGRYNPGDAEQLIGDGRPPMAPGAPGSTSTPATARHAVGGGEMDWDQADISPGRPNTSARLPTAAPTLHLKAQQTFKAGGQTDI